MIKSVVPTIPYTLPTGTDLFIVTLTITDSPLYFDKTYYGTADKTVSEIVTAYEAGKDVYVNLSGSYFPLIEAKSGQCIMSLLYKTSELIIEAQILGYEDTNNDHWSFKADRYPLDSDTVASPVPAITNAEIDLIIS